MQIIRCKTNHLTNPIGFDMSHTVFTWVTHETVSKQQLSARIIVSASSDMEDILFDSGFDANIDSRGFELPMVLTPYTRYYWTVSVKGDEGDLGVSEANFFETGKMTDAWAATWITTSWEDQKISPYMRKSFQVTKDIQHARAYIIGLGLYELEINGQRIGNERLTPYCNAYDAWLQYQTFDITSILEKGDNACGVLLGNGWAKGKFGTFGAINTPYINDFALLCELHLTYTDGSVEKVLTDTSWLCHPSAVIEDSMYDGEVYDATKEIDGWSTPRVSEIGWEQARSYSPKGLGPVVDRMSPPVIVKETIKPLDILTTPAGEAVLDMGQNMVGWLKFRINEPKGTVIKISYGEVLQEDNFYRDNLRTAKCEYSYISDGTERVIEPHFTFYGFRFAKLEGFTQPIVKEDFTGCVVYSDLETIGQIETSDPLVNRLFLNALWGQKGNFLDVPTDCPQRDERMGWTGDAQVFSGTASFNMDTYAFYVKFMRDLYEEQKFSGGMVASTVPTFMQNKLDEASFIAGGACAWSDAATVIPWEVYQHTGDATILKRQYQSMKDWVNWIIGRDKASGDRKLWTVGFHFGDWLALDGPVAGGVMGGTDNGLLASAYYRLSTNIMAKTAKVLGYEEDATYYGTLSEQVKQAIQNEFFSKNGRSTIGTQTAHVVALHFDLVEEDVKQRVLGDLKALLKKSHMHLKTGFIGTPYLCRSLSNHGASDEACQLFFQEDYPSWLYEVLMGATTVWERWNSILPDGKISGTEMNSLNHYAYGSIVEWMYRNVCGLNPQEETPGFKEFVIRPQIYGKLTHAKATLQSAMGLIEAGWKRVSNKISLVATIPFNTQARLILPFAQISDIEGIQNFMSAKQVGDSVEVTLVPGSYEFSYTSTKNYDLVYSLSSPLWDLKSNPTSRAILEKYMPHLVSKDNQGLGFELPYTIQEVIDGTDGFMKGMFLRGTDVQALENELVQVPYGIRAIE